MGGDLGTGRERGIDTDRDLERARLCFGEQTEHESSEQLLTELLEGVRFFCGGGDGGLFDLGRT